MTLSLLFIGLLSAISVAQSSSKADRSESANPLSLHKGGAPPCEGEGLDGIIVEKYYISDANDATDTNGGSLPEGSITYRIYVDMAAGYTLETIFGSAIHNLTFGTSTEFFNNTFFGQTTGTAINELALGFNTTALDSYLTFGGTSNAHLGILKSLDTDGSIIGGGNNDGGSQSIPEGLLSNDDPEAGIPLITSDGLVDGTPPPTVIVGDLSSLMPTYLGSANAAGALVSSDGAFAVLGGIEGTNDENQLLIAQITTDGVFNFELNIRLGTPEGEFEQYVHSDPGIIPGSDGIMELTCADMTYVNDPSVVIGLEDLEQPIEFTLYPNPNEGESIQIDLGDVSEITSIVSIKVLDPTGRQVYLEELTDLQGDVLTVHLDHVLKSGIYFMNIAFEGYSLTKRFSVQH